MLKRRKSASKNRSPCSGPVCRRVTGGLIQASCHALYVQMKQGIICSLLCFPCRAV